MSDPTANNEETKLTVGLDLGDRHTQVCVVDEAGEVIEEARLATRPQALRRRFCGAEPLRIVLEAGTHSVSSAISRRPRLVLGSVSHSVPSIGTSARLIATRPFSMSKSPQMRPGALPRRQPVIATKRHRGWRR
jgi:hypothetical protein